MNRLIVFAMLVMASCYLFAQNTSTPVYTVKGILVDSLTMESEPYATIRIVKKEDPDKPVKLAVTDNDGKFQEQLTGSGVYIMSVSSIGKINVVREFTLEPSNRTMDFGTLFTMDDSKELAAVEVVAQKPLVKVDIDKIEYNIQDDPDSQTNSMLEMLRKVPLVTVDGEDNIQVNGSSSFKVHVNGKPNNMMSNNPTEVLKSMPANSIKYIEVITNPGAKYDAEGVGGILNIVTIGGGFEGYTVTFTGNASNRGAGGSLYGTVQKGKLTVTGNYSYNYNDNARNYSYRDREFASGGVTEKSEGSSKSTGNFQHGNLEASYEIDTLRLVTLAFGLYGGGNDSNSESTTDKRPDYYYKTTGRSNSDWYSIRGNIDYQRLFALKGRMLTFSYRISSQPRTSDGYTFYTDTIITNEWKNKVWIQDQRSDGKTNTMEQTFQGDYVTPIGDYHTIETGAKYIIRDNTSDTKFYNIDNTGNEQQERDRSTDYRHLNNILAAYAGYTLRYKALSGNAGLRFEHTMLDAKDKLNSERDFDTSYSDLVPSATIGVKLGQSQNLRAGYNMRIWRPSIYYLNPYRDTSNPTRVSYGNPDLDTEKSHAFNISYSNFTHKFNINLSLRYSINNNSIEGYSYLEDDIEYSSFANIGKNQYTGLSAYVNWNASPKTRVYINMNGGYSDYRVDANAVMKDNIPINKDTRNSGWNIFAFGGIQHTFPLEIRGSFNMMGSSSNPSLQGEYGGFYDYSFGLNKSFVNKRLTVSAFANNIFNKYTTNKNYTSTDLFTTHSKGKYSRQRFGVSVSYRIGELKAQVKKAARTISNDDVKGDGGGDGGN